MRDDVPVVTGGGDVIDFPALERRACACAPMAICDLSALAPFV